VSQAKNSLILPAARACGDLHAAMDRIHPLDDASLMSQGDTKGKVCNVILDFKEGVG
jgi:hypothetical protein